MQIKKIVNFFFELGVFKREKHSGFLLSGVKDPDTLGEHTARAAQMGYILAEMEGVDPEKVATMLLIHDLGEIRVRDQHKLAARYYDIDKAERDAFHDQLNCLPEKVAKKWKTLFKEYNTRSTPEGVVAKDADWLETALTAKEYIELGYQGMDQWTNNVRKALETESAKKLLAEIENQKSCDWFKNLKKMTYKKLYK